MSSEVALIVQAIESLKEPKDWLSEWGLQFFTTTLSVFLGAAVTYWLLKHQEKTDIEKAKLDAVNGWIMKANLAYEALMRIKSIYANLLNEVPLSRTASIVEVRFQYSPITPSLENLLFTLPPLDTKLGEFPKWGQVAKIQKLFNDYNACLDLWVARNELNAPLVEKIKDVYRDRGNITLQQPDVIGLIGAGNYKLLIDTTERVVRLTDDLIIALAEFIEEYPVYVKGIIDTKKLKHYGSIIGMRKLKEHSLYAKTVAPDFSTVAFLYEMPVAEIEKSMDTGYPQLS